MLNYKVFLPDGMKITQGRNGSHSHQGANAYDEASKDSGKSNFYAPCKLECIGYFLQNDGACHYTFYESTGKVTLRDGTERKIQMMMLHRYENSNAAGTITVGRVYNKGDLIYEEGAAGNADGTHAHMEFGYGFSSSSYFLKQNSKGVWVANFSHHLDIEDVFYTPSDYKVYNNGGYNFRKSDVGTSSSNKTYYYWKSLMDFSDKNRYYNESHRLNRTDWSTCNLFQNFSVGSTLKNKYDSAPFKEGECVNSSPVGWSSVYTNDSGAKFKYYVHSLHNQHGNKVYFAYKKVFQ